MNEIRKRRKKRKFTKRKALVIIILIAILIGLIFLINNLIPVKNITDDTISVNLSTIKPTGKNITTKVSSKTKYDIYYYIDYSAREELYYENEELYEYNSENLDTNADINNNTTINNTNINNNINTNNANINNNNNINTNNNVNINNSTNTNKNTDESSSKNTLSNSSTNSVTNESKNANSSDKKEQKLDIKEIKNKQYKKVKNSEFEITNNGIVYLKYGRFGKLSSIPYVFEITNIDKDGPEIGDIETTTTDTSITVIANAIDKNQNDLQYYFKLSTSDTYISTGSTSSYTFKDLTTNENYIIQIKVTDKFGNESEAVTEATAAIQDEQEEKIEKKLYHFKVNLGANTVTVYEKDEDGEFTKPVKSFICSTGKSTPKSGTYKISVRYRWRSLFGGVYGQYAVRIKGNILFHSVPYKKMYPNTLEYEEYDKLGTTASAGCIRLCVRDAKWIYDNAKNGSTVEFYSNSSNPGPLGKPKAQKISNNKANRNWDPTDPDKHNPWIGGDGKVTKSTYNDYEDDEPIKRVENTVENTLPVQNTIEVKPEPNETINNTTSFSPDDEEPNTNTVSPSPDDEEPATNTVSPPDDEKPNTNTVSPSPDDEKPNTNTVSPPDDNEETTPPPVENQTVTPVENVVEQVEN